MKTTILYQYFQGLDEPGHALMLSFAQHLKSKREDVVVVSGEYGYMRPRKVELPLWRRLIRRETVDGVPVIRTYTAPYNLFLRFLSFLSFSATCLVGLLRGPRPDVVYASTPPLVPMFSAWLASRIRGAPLVLEVRDLWPASVVELLNVKSAIFMRAMSGLERFLYNRADQIVALTDGIREDIIKRGWPPDKVHTIRYGIFPSRFHPDEAAGREIRIRNNWVDKKIVIYFGAHGRANNLDVILRAASRLDHREDIRFVLIGDGLDKKRLIEEAKRMGLKDVIFHPPVPARAAPDYINAADLCVVTLKDIPVLRGAIPSKLIESMACGKAVVVGDGGEARAIVTNADAGRACDPDDDAHLASLIEELLGDEARRDSLGRSGCDYVRQHFSLQQSHAALHELLVATAGKHRRR
jgi:glycosyltransferase involved in cell wall biosynthesis